MDEREDEMRVTIFTGNYQITGVIELFQRARLTDYLTEAKFRRSTPDSDRFHFRHAEHGSTFEAAY